MCELKTLVVLLLHVCTACDQCSTVHHAPYSTRMILHDTTCTHACIHHVLHVQCNAGFHPAYMNTLL